MNIQWKASPLLLAALLALPLAGCGDDDDMVTPEPPLEVLDGIWADDGLGSIRADADAEQRELFERGKAVAVKRFTPEDGLGPRFNVTFCAACHEKPAFGGNAPRYRDFYLFGQTFDDGSFVAAPFGGVSHSYSIDPRGRYRPGRLDDYNVVARRNAIPFFGVGALAGVTEASILSNADPNDDDGDGISGRPNYDQGFVGRFGRKAQTVSIEGFIRGPLNNHLGITTDPLSNEERARLPIDSSVSEEEIADRQRGQGLQTRPQAQASAPATPLFDEDDVPDPEMPTSDLFDLVSWSMLLGAPRPDAQDPAMMRGEAVFMDLGCAACHVPTLATSEGLVPAWTDLLLHDMGDELGDGIRQGVAEVNEFRTHPLWGLAATGPYLHDGRADTLQEAIAYHGGEGQAAADAWAKLSGAEQEDVLAFLIGLGGASQASDGLLPKDAPIPDEGEPGSPTDGLSDDDLALWLRGRALFDRDVPLSDGLGPLFNGDSCRACHFDPVIGGAGPLDVNAMRFGTWEGGDFVTPEGGTLIHKLSSPSLPRKETGPHAYFEPRQTPSLLGLGAIDSISADTIAAGADPEDLDGDGVRGIVNVLFDGDVGRFGWKGGIPTVRDFVRDALSNEVGLTLPEEGGQRPGFAVDDDEIPDPEFDSAEIDTLTFYIANLAPPRPIADVPGGLALFTEVGCAACHTPTLEGAQGPVPLFSDLLLHNISADSALGVPEGNADGRHFRTSPLWGIHATAPYMHDGLSTTLEDAVAAHHGEASASVRAYQELDAASRALLLEFLGSL